MYIYCMRLLLSIFFTVYGFTAGAQKHRTTFVYQYKDDDSANAALQRIVRYGNNNRISLEIDYTGDTTSTQYFYDDTLLVKTIEIGRWFDTDNRDTSINYYYYDSLRRLQLIRQHLFCSVMPPGYGIGSGKGCYIPPSEIKREWQKVFSCEYYIYDSGNSLVSDSSYMLPVHDTGRYVPHYASVLRYKYTDDNRVSVILEDKYAYSDSLPGKSVQKQFEHYIYFKDGYVKVHDDVRGTSSDSFYTESNKVLKCISTLSSDGGVSKSRTQYWYTPDGMREKKEFADSYINLSRRSSYLTDSSTEVYHYLPDGRLAKKELIKWEVTLSGKPPARKEIITTIYRYQD